MLVSFRRRLVIFAMPKCASTSLETVIGPEMDMVMSEAPGLKHTNFRKYDRYLRPYLESFTDGRFETVCLFREPIDWLNSWWRYRQRPDVPERRNSTAGMTFDRFVRDYMEGTAAHSRVGRQARFVSNRDGKIGMDHIFRYGNLDGFLDFLEDRLKREIVIDRLNVSPSASGGSELSAETEEAARHHLSDEYRIYADIAR